MRPFSFLLSALLLLWICPASGQHNDYIRQIDSLVKTTKVRPFSGVVFIAENGRTKYIRAYGYADSMGKKLIAVDDQFAILSNTKQITAVLILQEVDKGHIDLNTPIRKYLPGLPQPWADTITVHQLLNHTSGVVVEDLPLAFKAGNRYQYSNYGYSLLARIAEHTAGKTYEALVTELFRKCGMKKTIYPTAGNQLHLVTGKEHRLDNTVKPVTGIVFGKDEIPFGGMISNAHDLFIWNEMLHNGRLLQPETYKRMISYSVKNQHPVFGEKEVGYGYGLRVNDNGSIKELGHTGYASLQGFTAVNLYYPATRTSVIVLENQAYDNFDIAYYFEAAIRNIVLQSGILVSAGR